MTRQMEYVVLLRGLCLYRNSLLCYTKDPVLFLKETNVDAH